MLSDTQTVPAGQSPKQFGHGDWSQVFGTHSQTPLAGLGKLADELVTIRKALEESQKSPDLTGP